MRARLSICALAACGLIAAPSASAADCPNEALREAQGATALPGCMALEMVSPPKKFAQPAFSASFSTAGGRVLFRAQTALAQTPGLQHFSGDRYVATRGSAGWSLTPTSPFGPIVAGGDNYGGPAVFSPNLDRWAQLIATQSESIIGVSQLFRGGLEGDFTPLSPDLVPIDHSGSSQLQFSVELLALSGSSTDLSTNVLQGRSSLISYLPGDPSSPPGVQAEEPGGDRNSYVAFLDQQGTPALELLARDKDGLVFGGRCGAHLGGPDATVNQGAISALGELVYFSTRPAQPFNPETGEGPQCDVENPTRILRRTVTESGPVIEPLLPGALSEWEEPGDDTFEAASADGTRVYFTSPRKLSASDSDGGPGSCGSIPIPAPSSVSGCDLYLFDSEKSDPLIHVSDPHGTGPANVLSTVAAVSGDGSRAYFVAQGVLAGANGEGGTPTAGEPNLYLYEAGDDTTTFIGTLSPEDRENKGGIWGAGGSFFGNAYAVPLYGADGLSDETGGDGHILAFASKAPLTDDDSDGGFRDVFRYDAVTGAIERISKAAPGGSDQGPFDVTVNPNVGKEPETNFGEQSRWVSEDGLTIGFATEEALIPTDSEEGVANPYLWQGGELGAAQAAVPHPPAVSPPGDEISFSTPVALLPQDKDTAEDVYVAREGGGFAHPEPPAACDPLSAGGCRALVTPPPPTAVATAIARPGNVKPRPRCRKGLVKRKKRCIEKRRAKGKRGAKRSGRVVK